jgi:hypothetical protein
MARNFSITRDLQDPAVRDAKEFCGSVSIHKRKRPGRESSARDEMDDLAAHPRCHFPLGP